MSIAIALAVRDARASRRGAGCMLVGDLGSC